jgi:MFS family permease
MRPYIKLLSHRPARRYFAAFTQSSVGTGLGYLALLLLAYQRLHSALTVSGVLVADYLPSMVLGAVLGVAVDRLSRRQCAALGDVIAAAAFVGLAFARSLPAVFSLALLAGVGTALNGPSVMAAMPSLVRADDMPAATALYNAIEKAGFVLGPLIGSLLLVVGGIPLLMVLNGISFLLSAAVVWTIPFGHAPDRRAVPRSLYADARAGFAALRSLPSVTALVLASGVVAVCFAAFAMCEVVFATDVFHLSGPGFAALCAVMSVTMTLGSLSGAASHGSRTARARYFQGMAALGIGLALIAVAPSLWVVLAGYLIAGYGNGRESVHDRLLVTELVPDELRGRVFSLRSSVLSWGAASAIAAGGALVAVVGPRGLIGVAAIGVLITWALAHSRVRVIGSISPAY